MTAGQTGNERNTFIAEESSLELRASTARPAYRPAVSLWLNVFFFLARHAPSLLRWTKPCWMLLSRFLFARPLRSGIERNASWLLGPEASKAQRTRLASDVLANFYMFIHDVGRASRLTPAQIEAQIDTVENNEHFAAARALGRGVIVATAHMGSFEVGIAAIRHVEPRVHVAFQHDNLSSFDKIRRELHAKLGVIEAPVDEGWSTWLKLRDALLANEVVLMQGDRTMPGHRGAPVPFCGGHMLMPLGPVKLAAITGAPIVPVFTLRVGRDKVRIVVDSPIHVEPALNHGRDNDAPPALIQLAQAIERQVKAHPEQWLMLHPAWIEDAPETQPSIG